MRPRAGTIALVHYEYDLPSVDFCQGLFDFNGAFVMPGVAFGEEHAFRLGYACARDVLEGGLSAVSAYLRTLEGLSDEKWPGAVGAPASPRSPARSAAGAPSGGQSPAAVGRVMLTAGT